MKDKTYRAVPAIFADNLATEQVSLAAAAMGRKGGSSRSPAKIAAVRANVKKATEARKKFALSRRERRLAAEAAKTK